MRSMQAKIRSTTHSPIFWMLVVVGLAAIGSNLTAGDGSKKPEVPASDSSVEQPRLLREGTRIESRMVQVRQTGDSLVLETLEDKQVFEALESLALERLQQALRSDSNDKRWLVTGQVTEFKGRNFLLLERVIRAPRTNP
jgi:hypothetical protein